MVTTTFACLVDSGDNFLPLQGEGWGVWIGNTERAGEAQPDLLAAPVEGLSCCPSSWLFHHLPLEWYLLTSLHHLLAFFLITDSSEGPFFL